MNTLLTNSKFRNIFEQDKNNLSKVYCKFCRKSYVPRPKDCLKHINTEKHRDCVEKHNKDKTIDKYLNDDSINRAEIIWSHFTVMKNLSFLLSDYSKDLFKHMFIDSKIANSMIINR